MTGGVRRPGGAHSERRKSRPGSHVSGIPRASIGPKRSNTGPLDLALSHPGHAVSRDGAPTFSAVLNSGIAR